MSVFFALIDRSSGNVIKDYETEAAALVELEAVVRDYGVDEIRDFALLEYQDGVPIQAAMDDELIARGKDIEPTHRSSKSTTASALLPNTR
ncbi:MAG: hypothetical protein H0T18_05905 [Chloroflexia bacterium]|nr:hypothetical protein [Chloroflexia bacterium]